MRFFKRHDADNDDRARPRVAWHHGVLALCAATLVWGLVVVRPDHMVVAEVNIEGQERVSASSLRHLADIHIGTRIWEVGVQEVERKVERHPWVRSVQVRRMYPDTVEIEVEEHVPRALLVRPRLVALDGAGRAIAEVGRSDMTLPLFTGVDEGLEREHPDLPQLVVQCQLELLRDVETLLEGTGASVSEVHFSKRQGFTVYAGRAEVLFSHGDFERQFAKLDYLVSEEGLRLDRPVQVDLAPEELAVVVPRSDARSG